MVDSYLKDTLGSREEHGEVVEVTTKEYTGITARELSNEWARVVDAMTRNGVMVANADHALEGALSIRYDALPADIRGNALQRLDAVDAIV